MPMGRIGEIEDIANTVGFLSDDAIAVITLDAPEALNALAPEDMFASRQTLTTAQDDDDVRVIVVTGEGHKAFCAGANLKKTFLPESSFANGALSVKTTGADKGGYRG